MEVIPDPAGSAGSSGATRDEIERMIGRRVENMSGIFVLGFILCWVGTAGGIYVGVTIYPWAYPLPSGIYALSVLTVIEVLGVFWMLKIAAKNQLGCNILFFILYNFLILTSFLSNY